jgi:hypothetical protein
MVGYTQGRPGPLTLYSLSSLLKISICLKQQDGLYYCATDTFTFNTHPHSTTSPFVGRISQVPDHYPYQDGLEDAFHPCLYNFPHPTNTPASPAIIEKVWDSDNDNYSYDPLSNLYTNIKDTPPHITPPHPPRPMWSSG